MNDRRARLCALALAALLWGCGKPATPPPLAGARIGGPFVLTDDHGRRFTDRDLLGHWTMIYFGYSFCPDACPTDLQVMAQGLRRFAAQDAARAAKVVPVFVSVDPARDTPAVLRAYVAAFHPRMVGLTGPLPAIAAMETEYGVYSHIEPVKPGASGYLVDHSRTGYLFGPDGRPIALITPADDAAAVAALLDSWVA